MPSGTYQAADKASKQARIRLNEPTGDLLKQLRKEIAISEAASARSLKILSRVACLREDEANTSTDQPRQESEREKFLALQNWGNDGSTRVAFQMAGNGAGK